MINKKLALVCIFLMAGILLAACGGGATPSDGSEEQPSEATPASSDAGGGDNPPAPNVDLSLDPANLAGDNAQAAAAYLYESLVREQDGELAPALAQTATVSEDGLDYIFNLRQGVAFHDGATLDADVVVLNFNRWFDPADANRGSGEYAAWVENFGGFKGETTEEGKPKSYVDGIEKVDEFTVIIHLNAVDPDFLKKMTNIAFAIVSPDAFAKGDGGTGAYAAAANDGSTLTLEPFAGYWDAAAIPAEGMEVPFP